MSVGNKAAHAMVKNDVIRSNSVVNTGDNSYAVLRFEDGQFAAMQANSSLQIKEYRYDPKNLQKSNIVFTRIRGGIRFVTGSIGRQNPNGFRLSTPNATIGVHGTEFMVATVNDSLYAQVISGRISLSNKAGVAEFTAGQSVVVLSPDTLPAAIPSTALPSGLFSQLAAIPTPPNAVDATEGSTTDVAGPRIAPSASPTAIPETPVLASTLGEALAPSGVSVPGDGQANSASPMGGATPASTPDAGYHYVPDPLCDFCTGRPNPKPAHTPVAANGSAGNAVTGEPSLFGFHNLTPNGANTGEICAFCHTPQGSETSVSTPLWKPTTPSVSSYRAFSSLGSATAEATGSVSLSCLSCHDGSQAPNIVINTPGLVLNVLSNTQVDIGDSLKNHHPVGMPYAGGGQNQNAPEILTDPIAANNKLTEFNQFTSVQGNRFAPYYPDRGFFKPNDRAAMNDVGDFSKAGAFGREDFNKSTYSGSGSSTVWWIETPGSKKGRQKTDLYLFTRTEEIDSLPGETTISQPYVECATCHDPHSTNSTFLRISGGNARSQVCLTCHNK